MIYLDTYFITFLRDKSIQWFKYQWSPLKEVEQIIPVTQIRIS